MRAVCGWGGGREAGGARADFFFARARTHAQNKKQKTKCGFPLDRLTLIQGRLSVLQTTGRRKGSIRTGMDWAREMRGWEERERGWGERGGREVSAGGLCVCTPSLSLFPPATADTKNPATPGTHTEPPVSAHHTTPRHATPRTRLRRRLAGRGHGQQLGARPPRRRQGAGLGRDRALGHPERGVGGDGGGHGLDDGGRVDAGGDHSWGLVCRRGARSK